MDPAVCRAEKKSKCSSSDAGEDRSDTVHVCGQQLTFMHDRQGLVLARIREPTLFLSRDCVWERMLSAC